MATDIEHPDVVLIHLDLAREALGRVEEQTSDWRAALEDARDYINDVIGRLTPVTGTGTCRYCGRAIVRTDSGWIDPEATGDDSVWRETCDAHDTFVAEHAPEVV